MLKLFVYVSAVLLAGTICGACLGSGLTPPKPSIFWAIPFVVIFLAGLILGALPFTPR